MSEHEKERLSAIIQELNDRFGAGLTEKDRISLEHLESQLTGDASLQAAARSNTRENVRLTFEQRAKDQLQDMAASNFNLYKRIADDRQFGKALLDFLFEGFWRGREGPRPSVTRFETFGAGPAKNSPRITRSLVISWRRGYPIPEPPTIRTVGGSSGSLSRCWRTGRNSARISERASSTIPGSMLLGSRNGSTHPGASYGTFFCSSFSPITSNESPRPHTKGR
jgi:hypothetical protein